jgi:hypothetical protein
MEMEQSQKCVELLHSSKDCLFETPELLYFIALQIGGDLYSVLDFISASHVLWKYLCDLPEFKEKLIENTLVHFKDLGEDFFYFGGTEIKHGPIKKYFVNYKTHNDGHLEPLIRVNMSLEGTYVRGKPHGVFKEYQRMRNGELIIRREKTFVFGEIIEIRSYNVGKNLPKWGHSFSQVF